MASFLDNGRGQCPVRFNGTADFLHIQNRFRRFVWPRTDSSAEAFVLIPPGTAQWCLCESDVEVPNWLYNFEKRARP